MSESATSEVRENREDSVTSDVVPDNMSESATSEVNQKYLNSSEKLDQLHMIESTTINHNLEDSHEILNALSESYKNKYKINNLNDLHTNINNIFKNNSFENIALYTTVPNLINNFNNTLTETSENTDHILNKMLVYNKLEL